MTTERLYYTASYQSEFDATLAALTTLNDRPAVLLDRTCFYPTSGGQPYDIGNLGEQVVVDVVVDEKGEVWHLLGEPWQGVAVGGTVQGRVDWPRRYDHMQQHSGQHLLSQIFFRSFGFETVSVHFGPTESTLDLDVATVESAQFDAAEQQANDLIYAALPIRAYFVGEAELAQVPLRRPPKVTGTIRIVEIDAFDYSACGGTHVRTTGEIGLLKLTRLERRRGQCRITFLCGRRALQDYAAKHRLLNEAAAYFSTEIAEVPKLVERNLAQVKELQRSLQTATEQLLRYEAAALAEEAGAADQPCLVRQLFADRDVETVKMLAQQLQQLPNVIALLATVAGGKLTLFFARSSDIDLHMGNLLRDTLQQAGGKGGGRPDFAQGGLADVTLGAALLDIAASQVSRSFS